jgi:TolB-like protein
VAQIVGAVATISLGVYVVSRSAGPPMAAPVTPSAPIRAARPAAGPATLAVLPLDNFSGDPRADHFVDAMTEALIANLAQVKGLRVVSRTSSMLYKGQRKPVPQIADELGVDLVVEGSVMRVGERVRVTAQLIDARRDEHLWARTYDHTVRDVLALQASIAAAIAGELKDLVAAR